MRDIWKKRKESILQLIVLLLGIAVVSLLVMLALLAFDVLYMEGGSIHLHVEMFREFRSSWYGWLVIIGIQMLLSTLLCFVPGTSITFILLIQALYEKPWQAFLLALTSMTCSSMVMYLIGRVGGYRIFRKLLGEKDCERASALMRRHGTVYFPLMMTFPIFPDNALVMIAGTLHMSMKWFLPSVIIGRGIGIATTVFGLAIVPFDRLTTPWHWIGFVVLCILLVGGVFYLAHKLSQYMIKRQEKDTASDTDTDSPESPA